MTTRRKNFNNYLFIRVCHDFLETEKKKFNLDMITMQLKRKNYNKKQMPQRIVEDDESIYQYK